VTDSEVKRYRDMTLGSPGRGRGNQAKRALGRR
jgi:hypothetical protein